MQDERNAARRSNGGGLAEDGALPLPGDSLTSIKVFNRLVCFLLRVDWGPWMRDHPRRM